MDMELRYAPLNSEGGVVRGVVMRYLTIATIGGAFRETVVPGAFRYKDVTVNMQHDRSQLVARNTPDGGLTIVDSAEEMRASIEFPPTSAGNDAAELVRRKILQCMSVEMKVREERWSGDLRTIKRADLYGISLVDRSAYSDSQIEIAQRMMVDMLKDARIERAELWRIL